MTNDHTRRRDADGRAFAGRRRGADNVSAISDIILQPTSYSQI
jgi:hypothetical protein